MPCDSKPRRIGETIGQRKASVVVAVSKLAQAIAAGRVRVKIGPQGAIAFEGWTELDRDGITDACAYRRILVSGSSLALTAIARAEQLAGRSVDRAVVAAGVHSHDGVWHGGHKS